MHNAADELADILESWAVVEKGTIASGRSRTRGRRGVGDIDYWHDHAVALEKLVAVERFVIQLGAERPNPSHNSLILRCYKAVFGFSPNWTNQVTQNGGAPLMSEGDIGLLRTIGIVMEQRGELIAPSEQAMDGIRQGLSDLRDLTADHLGTLPAELRSYLTFLIGEAEQAIVDVEGFGYLSVRSKVAEIGGLVVSIVLSDAVVDPETKGRLQRVATVLLGNVAGSLGAVGVIEGGTAVIAALGG